MKCRPSPRLADHGVQPERTSLAWERTAFSTMVAGILLSRVAAEAGYWSAAGLGLGYVIAGSVMLVWAGRQYSDRLEPANNGADIVNPGAARALGLVTVSLTFVATLLAFLSAVR